MCYSISTIFVDQGEIEAEHSVCTGLEEDKCTDDVGCDWDGETNQCGDKAEDTSANTTSMDTSSMDTSSMDGKMMDPSMHESTGNDDYSPSNAEVETFAPF